MTKLEIIEDTIKYYSEDTSRRSIHPLTCKCLYKGPDCRECAFQRVVETDLSQFDGVVGISPSALNIMQSIDVVFKPGYEGHSEDFWNDVQILHDNSGNWSEGHGLTPQGIAYVERLKKTYSKD